MPGVIVVLALIAIIALAVVISAAVHVLFSPWLIVAAVAVLAWLKFRPHRAR
jgi:hypothetical protein